jgi:hypothetical protein
VDKCAFAIGARENIGDNRDKERSGKKKKREREGGFCASGRRWCLRAKRIL